MADIEVKTYNGQKVIGVALRSKAKTIHFLRHAEGTHNEAALTEGRAAYAKIEHLDARLTDLGRQQCSKLKATNHGIEKEAELVVVSPLTRAIQTAMLTIDKAEGVPWIALECVRERAGGHPCDRRRKAECLWVFLERGRESSSTSNPVGVLDSAVLGKLVVGVVPPLSVSELKEEFPTISFDAIEHEEDVYYEALGDERETNETVADRARELFSWLRDRPETNIAVVTHSAFLLCLFNQAILSPPDVAKWFENCELRTVVMDL